MFSFFRQSKANINSISFPDFGWKQEKNSKDMIQWINPEQTTALSVNFFNQQPDLPTLKNIDALRQYYRKSILANNGGIIEIELIELQSLPVIRTIFKFPQQPKGMTYLASLTIPFGKFSYVLKIQAPEVGMTGIRDSVVLNKLMSTQEVSLDKNGMTGWSNDPYQQDYVGGTLMNKSEDAKYDLEFPAHPLSAARLLLTEIQTALQFQDHLITAKKFNP